MTDSRDSRERHELLGRLFTEARQLPAADRPAFLESHCDDAELRAEVLALLEESAGSLRTDDIQLAVGEAAAAAISSGGTAPQPGATIGPYTLLELLGEGGFGVVYAAEQTEPVQRHVALKVIKPGMDSAAVIARFTAEHQALALMDHPAIAHVYGGGTTPGGLPFFVMELIPGEPITEYADQLRLTIEERIELFIQVCEAVQHAHSKGVIHRDLKPSNLLVEQRDGRAAPKVIDFGIAKALGQPLTDMTLATRQGQLVGSLEYMSPEQADFATADVDTRTDIYALGIVLYELLTGLAPFDTATLRESSLSEIQRIIRDVDPPRPSARLTAQRLGDAAASASDCAEARRTDLNSLIAVLRRDLDWVIMRCLEKDRDRRYRTANGLAMDLRRFLAYEPVLAGPPGFGYRFGKFVRRHRTAVASAAVAAIALIAATAISIGFAARAEREAVAAELARQEAALRAEQLRQVADFQAEQLGAIDPTTMGVQLRQAILDAAPDEHYEALEASLAGVSFTDVAMSALRENIFDASITAIDERFSAQPRVHAQMLQTVANVLLRVGLLDLAVDPQQRALSIRRAELGNDHPDTLSSVNSMGELLHLRGKLDEADSYFREALEASTRVNGEDHPDTIRSVANLGALLRAQNRFDEAEPYLRDALEKRRRVLGDEHEDTLVSLNNLGLLLRRNGNYEEAGTYYSEALQIRRRVLGDEHPDTLTSMNNLGAFYWSNGDADRAEPYLREALQTRRRVLGEDHPATLSSISNLGVLLQYQGKLDEAEPYYLEALEARTRLLGEDHPSRLTSLSNMGALLHLMGRLDDAERVLLDSLERRRRVSGPEHSYTLIAAISLGAVYRSRGDYAEAIELLTSIEDPARRTFTGGNAHRLGLLLTNLGRARAGRGFDQSRFAAAEGNLIEAYEAYVATRGEEHKSTRECAQAFVDLYTTWDAEMPGNGYDEKVETWQARL